VGWERFLRGMRAYSEHWRYAHPYPQDFFDAFQAGAEAKLDGYFEQVFRSTATVDWKVEVAQRRELPPEGWFQDVRGVWQEGALDLVEAARGARGQRAQARVGRARSGPDLLPRRGHVGQPVVRRGRHADAVALGRARPHAVRAPPARLRRDRWLRRRNPRRRRGAARARSPSRRCGSRSDAPRSGSSAG